MTSRNVHEVSGLGTAELLRVFRASLIAQEEAVNDNLQFIGKAKQVVAELSSRLDQQADRLKVEESAAVEAERTMRAQLTRENADLRHEIEALQKRLAQRPAPPARKAPAAADAPWRAFRSRPGEGSPGLPPYGHRWINGTGDTEPVEYEQKVIATIRSLRKLSPPSGWWSVARELNRQGFKTRRGNVFKSMGVARLWDRVLELEAIGD